MKTIGILYICTGEYWKFWENFYKSSEKYFLTNCEIHYFLFTNNDSLLSIKNKKIHPIYQKQMEWPYPTLFRFKTFHDFKNNFKNMDYLIFCNANLLFMKNISFDKLFSKKPMFATLHPGFFDKVFDKFTDESRKNSLAYINRNKTSKYVCGGFNGGTKEYFLKMADRLNSNIDIDLKNNIIAIWHDESHFNCYVEENKKLFNIINPSFCYPESGNYFKNSKIKLSKMIIVLDKKYKISLKHKKLFFISKIKTIKYLKSIIASKWANFKNLLYNTIQ